jgi:hypothetical protein
MGHGASAARIGSRGVLPCGEPRHRMIRDAIVELSYQVVSDAARGTPSIYIKKALNEANYLNL